MTVSEFVAILNQSLDMIMPQVIIAGEISNFRVSKNRWVYFDLKDKNSSVRFFGTVYTLPGPLEDGITVEVSGRPRLHNQFGFSVNFDSVRAVGEGAIRKAQDLLFKKLEAEGLFAIERKRPIPYAPERIGLVTSAESAAIADFKKIIGARWPSLKIDLQDSLVQGAQAPVAIVQSIQAINAMSNPPEVLVIIRGGGSADDLAAFSDESVVRAVAASRIPTVVAIGHESDTCLAELAADLRASTPSNAAELLVPDITQEKRAAQLIRDQLTSSLGHVVKHEQAELISKRDQILMLIRDIIRDAEQHVAHGAVLLKALDPLLPLQQGYALVQAPDGTHIRTAAQLKKSYSEAFTITFTDKKIEAQLKKGEQ